MERHSSDKANQHDATEDSKEVHGNKSYNQVSR